MKRLLLYSLFTIHCSLAFSQPKPEFRGVWMASVDNIDWPKRGEWNVDSQKSEYIRQVDLHKQNGMNALIVQVRPASDALYPSPYEPFGVKPCNMGGCD